jgi:uncharacterized protein
MEVQFIGRKQEQAILQQTLQSGEAEMVAVIGRRRVGKTFLVNTVFGSNMVFDLTGVQNGGSTQQLQNFADQLEVYRRPYVPAKRPANWQEAFKQLREYLTETLAAEAGKKVIFLDELPWLAGQKSGFLDAFGYFWNSWASRQRLVVVICGSAASWMIQRVVNDRGGLHNRITRRVFLEPFTLAESEAYLQSRGVFFDRYQLTQLYMAMGGIPHYLKEVESGKSAMQNIERICFSKQGILSDEFERLLPSLFAESQNHVAIVRALTEKKQGMTRSELAEATQLPNGGGLTKVLEELNQSGFISDYYPFGKKKKEKTHRLTDEYTLFYHQFIAQNRYQGANTWMLLSQTAAYKSWAGYAFEGICLKHLHQIKQALGISGVYTMASSFIKKGTADTDGAQIDFVLDRNDHIIHLFEVKFHNKPFAITKEYADKLRKVQWAFEQDTQTRKQVNWVVIAAHGMTQNQYSLGLVSNALTLDDLF